MLELDVFTVSIVFILIVTCFCYFCFDYFVLKHYKFKHDLIKFINGQETHFFAGSSAYDFSAQSSNNSSSGKFRARLVISSERKDSFLLENHIEPSALSEITTKYAKNLFDDGSSVNDIYLEIQYSQTEIIIERETIKPSKALIDKVTEALSNNNPYHELVEVFRSYGYFVPKEVFFGNKLYRMTCLIANEKSLEPTIKTTEWTKNFTKDIYDDILSQWETLIKPHSIDETYLVSINGNIIMKDDIEKWVKSCSRSYCNSLKPISWCELYPLYEIFEKDLRQKVKSVLGIYDQSESFIKEKVLMTGSILIEDGAYYYRVTFPTILNSNKYQIFGKLMTKDGRLIDETVVKFKSMDIRGFSAKIENFKATELMNSLIVWLMIGIPGEVGFFSTKTRNIIILNSGISKCPPNLNSTVKIPELLHPNSIIVTSFIYPSSNNEQNLIVKYPYYHNNNNEIELKICDYSSSFQNDADCELSSSDDEFEKFEVSIRWFILLFPENFEFTGGDVDSDSVVTIIHLKAIGINDQLENFKFELIKLQEMHFFANSSACDFSVRPSNNSSHGKFRARLVIFSERINSFLLENHIELSTLSEITTKFAKNLFDDGSSVIDIYLEIQYSQTEMIIEKETRKLSKALIDKVTEALKDLNPYHKLVEIFNSYGYFIPKKVILENKLYRMTCLIANEKSLKPSIKTTKWTENFTKDTYDDILSQWENLIKPHGIDETYLELRQKVKSVLGINDQSENFTREKVLMTGSILIEDGAYYYRVTFPTLLNSNKYQIFGKLMTKDGRPIDKVVIKFKSMDIRGFSAKIENFNTTDERLMNSQIAWLMIGIPGEVGFFSTKTRYIVILNTGINKCPPNLNTTVKVPEPLHPDSIIVTSLIYPSSNNEPNFVAKFQFYHNNEIKLKIYGYNSSFQNDSDSELSNSDDEFEIFEVSIRWSILLFPENFEFNGGDITPDSAITTIHLKAIGQKINELIITKLIESQTFNHGLLVNTPKIDFADFSACSFESQPEINAINNLEIRRTSSVLKQRDSFLLRNCVEQSAIDLNNINWISDTDFKNNPLTDVSSTKDVYIETRYSQIELIFKKKMVKPSPTLTAEIKKALEYHNPYHELIKVFRKYGHFLPKKVILGHRLCLIANERPKYCEHDWKTIKNIKDYATSEFNDILEQWKYFIKPYNIDALFSSDGITFTKDDLYKWIVSCSKNDLKSLQVVSWSNLYPIYEIFENFDKYLYHEIKSILEVKEKVLMSDVIPVNDSVNLYIVNFPTPLYSDNYEIFGKFISRDGEPIDEVIVKFKDMNKLGFTAVAEDTAFMYKNPKIAWILIGIPAEIGYFSQITRKINVLDFGIKQFALKSNNNIVLEVPKNLPQNSVIVVLFKHSHSHYEPKLIATIKSYQHNKILFNIRCPNYESSDSEENNEISKCFYDEEMKENGESFNRDANEDKESFNQKGNDKETFNEGVNEDRKYFNKELTTKNVATNNEDSEKYSNNDLKTDNIEYIHKNSFSDKENIIRNGSNSNYVKIDVKSDFNKNCETNVENSYNKNNNYLANDKYEEYPNFVIDEYEEDPDDNDNDQNEALKHSIQWFILHNSDINDLIYLNKIGREFHSLKSSKYIWIYKIIILSSTT
ncbi:hsp70 family protein [Gigaspora margarita]|uniref:Hsp70 family protein n=1 Tax=Gigaspora margarita TaxID=4874 RepID=A0A8H4EVI6_GIGMA|nr:hsp70 family protein [Gigaspora margarita]